MLLFVLTFVSTEVLAQQAPAPATTAATTPAAAPNEEEIRAQLQRFEALLQYQTGDVTIGSGLARVNLGSEFRYLDPVQTNHVLQLWGNPPNERTLGLIVPTDTSLVNETGWAVVLNSTDDGHVNDDDANDINFDEVLEEMKRDARTSSEQRVRMGLSPLTLVGWAERPHYDRATHILYWAKDLDGGGGMHSLNYAMRVLGRTQVLELNAVASMEQLPMVRARMEVLRQRVRFEQGRRYSDFVPSADRVAAYGLGALVAGKVIAKTGLLKVLLGALIAGKKLVAAAFVALLAGLRSLFGKRESGDTATPPSEGDMK
jgi:uncharacterized membrane-anchored protein